MYFIDNEEQLGVCLCGKTSGRGRSQQTAIIGRKNFLLSCWFPGEQLLVLLNSRAVTCFKCRRITAIFVDDALIQ